MEAWSGNALGFEVLGILTIVFERFFSQPSQQEMFVICYWSFDFNNHWEKSKIQI